MSEDPTKKTYTEEIKDNFTGIGILLLIGITIWFFTDVLGLSKGDDTPSVRREPTQQEIEQWEREYYEYGNTDPDIDTSEQYGGK